MKIYRVVPNGLFEIRKLRNGEFIGSEAIYYGMGYTSFLEKKVCHAYNNIYKNINEEGKYFYLFFEDAVKEGHNLMTHFHGLNTNDFFIAEYDVPGELLLKNIGFGDYTEGIMPWYIIETYIEKSCLGEEIISTDYLPKEQKLDSFFDSFYESLKLKRELRTFDFEERDWYCNLFRTSPYGNELNDIIDNPENVKNAILHGSLDMMFLFHKGEAIKCPYITKRIIPINNQYNVKNFCSWANASEYYEQLGFQFDVSKEQNEFKEYLLNYLGKYSGEKDIEQVKLLLKERKYI